MLTLGRGQSSRALVIPTTLFLGLTIGVCSAVGLGLYAAAFSVTAIAFLVLTRRPVWALAAMGPLATVAPVISASGTSRSLSASGLLDVGLLCANTLVLVGTNRSRLAKFPWSIWVPVILMLVIGLMRSSDMLDGTRLVVRLLGTATYALAIAISARKESDWKLILGSMLISYFLPILVGITEIRAGLHGARIPSIFGLAPVFSIFLVWPIQYSLVKIASSRGRQQMGWGALLITSSVLDVLTATRISWLVGILSIIVVQIYYPRFITKLVLPSILAVTVLTIGPVAKILTARFLLIAHGISEKVTVSNTGNSVVWRLFEWKTVLGKLLSSPHAFFGYGTGSVFTEIAQIYGRPGPPHNEYIRLLYEQGIIGTALFLAATVVSIRFLSKHRESLWNRQGKEIYVLSVVGILGYLVVMLTDNPFDYNYACWPFWSIIGLGISRSILVRERAKHFLER